MALTAASINSSMIMRHIDLKIMSAEDIRNVKDFSKTHAYVVVSIAGDPRNPQIATTHIDNDGGSSPVWDSTFTFPFDDSLANQNRLTLEMKLLSHGAHGGEIGAVHIPFRDLLVNCTGSIFREVSYPVMRSGKNTGILLKLAYKFGDKVEAYPAKCHPPTTGHQPEAYHATYLDWGHPLASFPYPPASGHPTGAYPASGYPPASGHPPAAYPASGYLPASGYPPASGHPPVAYPASGYPPALGHPPAASGYPPALGHPPAAYPASGYLPASGYPPALGHSPAAYPASGYLPASGYPPASGHPLVAYPALGHPPAPYPASGYNKMGFGKKLLGAALMSAASDAVFDDSGDGFDF